MIIALRGKKGSGKSTAAEILKDLLAPAPVQVIGFADPIKQFVGHAFGFSNEVMNGPSELRDQLQEYTDARAWNSYKRMRDRIVVQLETWGSLLGRDLIPALPAFWAWAAAFSHECVSNTISPRRALQTFGTEFGREAMGHDVWIDLAFARAERFTKDQGRSTFTIIHDCRFDNEALRVKQAGGTVIEVCNLESEQREPGTHTTHQSEQPGKVPSPYAVGNEPSKGREPLRLNLQLVLNHMGI